MKVMRTYMRGDFVCCQLHEEVCSDSVQAGCVPVPWGGWWWGVTGFIMKWKPWLVPSVATFFNF